MERITENSRAAMEFCVEWTSSEAQHKDYFYTDQVNFWRDCFTPEQFAKFKDRQAGETIVLYDQADIPIGRHLPEKVHHVLPKQFNRHYLPDREIVPQQGRFYPLGLVQGLPGVFRANANLCRCIQVNNHELEVDLNHPLAGYPLTFTAAIKSIRNNSTERGGRCEDWLEAATMDGPGMQARYPGLVTDFADPGNFLRRDENADPIFYERTRLVHHIDSRAREIIGSVHQHYLQPGICLLDLMGSWETLLPEDLHLQQLTVLGMNEEELKANRRATARVVHDLNATPQLPFPEGNTPHLEAGRALHYDLFQPLVSSQGCQDLGRAARV
jgi:hypothetical protein